MRFRGTLSAGLSRVSRKTGYVVPHFTISHSDISIFSISGLLKTKSLSRGDAFFAENLLRTCMYVDFFCSVFVCLLGLSLDEHKRADPL